MALIHEDFLVDYLGNAKNRIVVASELSDHICKNYPNVSRANSRKIIESTLKKNKIKSSKPMTFGNNQYAYYSCNYMFSYQLAKKLIQKHKPALYRVIIKLFRNNGLISEGELKKISGCSDDNEGHSISYDDIIKDLVLLNLCHITTYDDITFFHKHREESSDTKMRLAAYASNLIAESALITNFLSWLKKSNIIDGSDSVLYRGSSNHHVGISRNNMTFDIFGYSSSFSTRVEGKLNPAIVLVDCYIHSDYTSHDFEGFIQRVNSIAYMVRGKGYKVIPIVFSHIGDPGLIINIKKAGCLILDWKLIYGTNALNIASDYIELKNSLVVANTADITSRSEKILKNINESCNSLNYGNMKGDLFEYIMRPFFEKLYNNCRITHRPLITENNKKYEADYLIDNEDEIILVELKGYSKDSIIPLGKFKSESDDYDKGTVKWFTNRTYPVFKKKYANTPNKLVKFTYITTGFFETKCKSVIENMNRSIDKPIKIYCFYDRFGLLDELKKYKMNNEIRIVEQYY